MCLSMRYLNHRDRVENLYSFIGYKSVFDIGISVDTLIKTGLLTRCETLNTAMIHGLKLTRKGKTFFRDVGYQLILLKPNSLEDLNYYMEDTTSTLSGKNDYLFYVLLFIPRIVLGFFSLFKREEF